MNSLYSLQQPYLTSTQIQVYQWREPQLRNTLQLAWCFTSVSTRLQSQLLPPRLNASVTGHAQLAAVLRGSQSCFQHPFSTITRKLQAQMRPGIPGGWEAETRVYSHLALQGEFQAIRDNLSRPCFSDLQGNRGWHSCMAEHLPGMHRSWLHHSEQTHPAFLG